MKKENVKYLWIFFGLLLFASGFAQSGSTMAGWNTAWALTVSAFPYVGAAFLAWGLSHY